MAIGEFFLKKIVNRERTGTGRVQKYIIYEHPVKRQDEFGPRSKRIFSGKIVSSHKYNCQTFAICFRRENKYTRVNLVLRNLIEKYRKH